MNFFRILATIFSSVFGETNMKLVARTIKKAASCVANEASVFIKDTINIINTTTYRLSDSFEKILNATQSTVLNPVRTIAITTTNAISETVKKVIDSTTATASNVYDKVSTAMTEVIHTTVNVIAMPTRILKNIETYWPLYMIATVFIIILAIFCYCSIWEYIYSTKTRLTKAVYINLNPAKLFGKKTKVFKANKTRQIATDP